MMWKTQVHLSSWDQPLHLYRLTTQRIYQRLQGEISGAPASYQHWQHSYCRCIPQHSGKYCGQYHMVTDFRTHISETSFGNFGIVYSLHRHSWSAVVSPMRALVRRANTRRNFWPCLLNVPQVGNFQSSCERTPIWYRHPNPVTTIRRIATLYNPDLTRTWAPLTTTMYC